MTALDPLSAAAILQAMADAISTHQQGDTTSDLSSSHEAIALFVHACMVSLGFRLLGFDQDKPEGLLPPVAPLFYLLIHSHFSHVHLADMTTLSFRSPVLQYRPSPSFKLERKF